MIVGLGETTNPKMSIVSALLVLAVADNISDSLGIHIYRESQTQNPRSNSRVYAISNFLTRLAVTLTFVLLVYFLPLAYAVASSMALGLLVLSALSYRIAVNQKANPYTAILHHVSVTLAVLLISHFLGRLIARIVNI